ncbi:MAG: 50S ribosomal protein L11 [Desulfurococcales archaeon]|nr:50S ribosomal protein L11 [Desulfurococcales archaeon]
MAWKTVRAKVKGGQASQAPPLGPALNQYGLDVGKVIDEINEMTKGFEGEEVTVNIYVNTDTKEYRIEVKSPSTTSLLLKAAGASKPSGDPAHNKVGNISLEDAIKVTLLKKYDLTAKTLKAGLKSILSTAATIGLTVDGKEPKEVVKEVEEGMHDELLLKYEEEWKKGR